MISHSDMETKDFAKKFAQKLRGGEVIGLIGDLGAGKTIFAKGLAEELGIKETITSPTFVILKEYNLRPGTHPRGGGYSVNIKKLVHIDAYRLRNLEDAKLVGLEDYLGRDDAVIVVEWAEKIKEILPSDTIYLKFKHLSGDKREILWPKSF